MSSDFYAMSIAPFAPISIKICRAYTNTQLDQMVAEMEELRG